MAAAGEALVLVVAQVAHDLVALEADRTLDAVPLGAAERTISAILIHLALLVLMHFYKLLPLYLFIIMGQ